MPRQSAFTDDFNLSPLFSEETQKATQSKIFHLITLVLPEPEPNFCIVDSNYDITFDSTVYTRFPVKASPAEMSSDGSISKASITVANVSREIMYYIEMYNGLRNCRVLIKTVYENVLDEVYFPQADGTTIAEPNTAANNTAFIEDEYLIDTYTATEQAVIFQLDPIIDLEIRLPRRRYLTDSCYFFYKDPNTCKYSGALTSCNKNLADCREHANERNFGGFPGVSASRRLFI